MLRYQLVNPRVLIVDDEESVRTTLAGALELHGFRVTEAGSAYEAVAQVRQAEFDLVISDVRMPGMDGIEGARAIREVQPDLPLILITAYEAEGILERALSHGAYTVVPKPLDVGSFMGLARRAAERPIVLVVDDQEACAYSMASALQTAGIRAAVANDAASAVAAIQEQPIDVAIIDLVLAETDGGALLDELRRLDDELIAIGVSGKNVDSLVHRMMDRGAYKCLQKPVDVRGLVHSVGRARCSSQETIGGNS